MPELRWILLVLGALLIGGLWWWELRRSRQPAPPAIPAIDQETRTADRFEPRLDAGAAAEAAEAPPARAPEERAIPRGDPPVVMFHDLPEDADQVVLAREPVAPRRAEPAMPPARREPAVAPDAWPEEDVVPDLDATPAPLPARAGEATGRTRFAGGVSPQMGTTPQIHDGARAPAGRREPSLGTPPDVGADSAPPLLDPASIAGAARTASTGASAAAPSVASTASVAVEAHAPAFATPPGAPITAPAATPAASGVEARRPAPRPTSPPRSASPPPAPVAAAPAPEPAKPTAPAEPPATLQRIIAIRLVGAGGERFDGAELRTALEAEGLRFGKYSIFHRQRDDGRTLYSVASLVEPGSFDPDRMHMLEFPGVSMFAVFPGPLDAPAVFDELLATARRLAGRLDGVLQDERGGPLSAQRALGIRDELVSFQNLVTRVRSRPAG